MSHLHGAQVLSPGHASLQGDLKIVGNTLWENLFSEGDSTHLGSFVVKKEPVIYISSERYCGWQPRFGFEVLFHCNSEQSNFTKHN